MQRECKKRIQQGYEKDYYNINLSGVYGERRREGREGKMKKKRNKNDGRDGEIKKRIVGRIERGRRRK